MGAQSCGVSLLTDMFNHFTNHFNLLVAHQPIAPVSLNLNNIHSEIDGLVNILKKEFLVGIWSYFIQFFLVQIGCHLSNDLYFTAGHFFVFGQKRV